MNKKSERDTPEWLKSATEGEPFRHGFLAFNPDVYKRMDGYSADDIYNSVMVEAMEEAFEIAGTIDRKTPIQAAAKLTEEIGELMREILIIDKTPGCTYRESSREKLIEESADVMLCLLAVMYKLGVKPDEMAIEMMRKSEKWATNSEVQSPE